MKVSINPLLTAIVGAVLSLSAVAAQLPATLSSPTLGYVWSDDEARMRPIHGITGNAVIGHPADLGVEVSRAIPLNGRHFVASANASTELLLINMDMMPPSLTTITDAPPNPSLAIGSANGSAAILYYPQHKLLVVTGLPSHPKVAHSIEMSGSDYSITHMAIDDAGESVIYAVTTEDHDFVYAWTPASMPRVLTMAEEVSAIAVAPNGDAIVSDAKADEVFSIMDPHGAAVRYVLADAKSGVSKPSGIGVSSSSQIIVANRGTKTIMILSSSGHLLRQETCGCDPSGLYPVRESIYRLTDRSDRPIFLLEAGSARYRITFVPPILNANQ